MTKRIVLCADDYGQAKAISQGIISLLKEGRLSAVSCMVTSRHWQEHAVWLSAYKDDIDIGLHFNLTENKESLLSLIFKANLRLLDQKILRAELNHQIDEFANALGFLPNFIDGHQHVHQFPMVRDALLAVYEKRLKKSQTYIRWVNPAPFKADTLTNFKKKVVRMLGARQLKELLDQHQIPYNRSFAGMYAFDQATNFDQIFKRMLANIEDGGLIMCHPGLPEDDASDPINDAREYEYRYLQSSHFLADLAAENAEISRFQPA